MLRHMLLFAAAAWKTQQRTDNTRTHTFMGQIDVFSLKTRQRCRRFQLVVVSLLRAACRTATCPHIYHLHVYVYFYESSTTV